MSEQSLYHWFADAVRRVPNAVALEVCGQALTYRQLRQASDALARRVEHLAGKRIGLLATRTPSTYIGYLAILRVGATVVPLNPYFPAHRNRAIAAQAGLSMVLGEQHDRNPMPTPDDDLREVAYILFTSGSTGTPKGIPIRHRNLSAYLSYNIDRYRVQPGCRLSQTFDLTFDPSVFDMFVSWGAGATLVVPQREELNDPVDFVVRHRLSHWFSVPSVISLAHRMRRLPAGAMPGLRWSLFAGEQLTLEQAATWAAAAPGSRIENLYGPTELTITCTAYRLPPDPAQWPRTGNQTVPIGRCYPHLEHLVLSDNGSLADIGELCVRGSQRFDGYLDGRNNVDRFVSFDPSIGGAPEPNAGPTLTGKHWYRTGDRVEVIDGDAMVHLGRLDAQVQVHGYRVELGDIEATLRQHPGVDEAAVCLHNGDLRAVCTGGEVTAAELSGWLAHRLPRYLLPASYAFVDMLPRNDNGKLDRKELAALS
jgi:non-ribosomal peptide synthetase component F